MAHKLTNSYLSLPENINFFAMFELLVEKNFDFIKNNYNK
jgi:hypothetical protein